MKAREVHVTSRTLEVLRQFPASTPVICSNCDEPMVVDDVVLIRPVAASCPKCGSSWEDHATYDPPCLVCGYSADHREGLGCRSEDG